MRYVYGVNPALAALRARPGEIERIYLADGARQTAVGEILARARKARIRVDRLPRERLSAMAEDGVHQGVVLEVKEYAYADLADLLAAAKAAGEPPLVVVLDGIQDPHNLGAIVRSAHAFGAHGVIVARDRAAGVTGAVVKASAGALEHTRLARVVNVARTVGELKESGLWAVAASPDGDRAPEDVDLAMPTALVIGSEGAGIRRLVQESCDLRVRIPIRAEGGSLNAAQAASLLLYEADRQRRSRGLKPR